MQKDVEIDIAPAFEGALGKLDLISPVKECFLVLNYVGMSPGQLFFLRAENYHLEVQITYTHAKIIRNNFEAKVRLAYLIKNSYFILHITWSPEFIRVNICDKEGERVSKIETPICFPPNKLKEWARRESLVPTVFYETPKKLFETVFEQFQLLKEKIIDTNAINGFWDIHYEGSKINSRKPKRETDIHPQIRLLLYDLEIIKNLQITPEYPIGSGQLDFLVTGTTKDGKTVNVCVEFKLAHSSDIAHGIQSQLPEYMDRRKTDFGIYCVLDFGSEYKTDTKKFVLQNIKTENETLDFLLPIVASQTGRKFLKTIIFDLSKQISPSKK